MARPSSKTSHLFEKRQEIMWALDYQEYNGEDIATIFSVSRSVVNRLLKKKPKDWEPKWIKVQS